VALLAAAIVAPSVADAERLGAYDFPFVDPVLATVVATPLANRPVGFPDLQRDRKLERHWVQPFPDRATPRVTWYEYPGVAYGLARQAGRAPLVVVIAGTGGSAFSLTAVELANALYFGGYHVLTIPSPTSLDFIIRGSETGVPGRNRDDARDLYRVIQLALADIRGRVDWSEINLTGLSLGGMNTAYVAELDSRERKIGFRKVLLLNPPVSLFNSTRILDGMFERYLGDKPGAFRAYLDALVTRFADIYVKSEGPPDFDSDFVYRIYRTIEPTNEDLETLVGVTFRLSAATIAFAADIMSRSGYMVASDAQLGTTAPLGEYAAVASALSFGDYIRGLYVPFFARTDPSYTLERAIQTESLKSIEGFLSTARNVALFTNEDDVILAKGELEYLERVFGDRATVFPTGGHCGNFTQHQFVDRLNAYFRH
jgi:hypothetical protein